MVHQAIVQVPLQEIINKSSSPGAQGAWEKHLERFAQRIPDEAIEAIMTGEYSSQE
jgi:hypothetical protein